MRTTQYVLKHKKTGAFLAVSQLAPHVAWVTDDQLAERYEAATTAAIASINLRIAGDVTVEPVAGPDLVVRYGRDAMGK